MFIIISPVAKGVALESVSHGFQENFLRTRVLTEYDSHVLSCAEVNRHVRAEQAGKRPRPDLRSDRH